MIITGISISAALLIPGYQGILLTLFLSQLQMLWDCCDGEIARWRDTRSPKGIFLDRIGHYLTESLIPIAFALRLSGWPESSISDWKLPFTAALISIMILLNKAFNDIVHVSRAFSQVAKLEDSNIVAQSRSALVRALKAPFKIFAVQRLFHSVEMTILITIFGNNQNLIDYGVFLALFVTVGHLVSILTSRKLDSR
jgi:phosphatidylglycerophosphate synthase